MPAADVQARPSAAPAAGGVPPRAGAGFVERPVVFPGAQGPVFGVICEPAERCHATMLIVAGQPQTRVGAHRMFVDLARGLARRGVASLRFDVGGWGDSPGEALAFERSAPDIAAAAAFLKQEAPDRGPLWVWGLCDGASAAVLALPQLREAGAVPDVLCLVNPWVRSEASLGAAMVRTYYAKRLLQREFWGRLLTGKVSLGNLVAEPWRHATARFRRSGTAGAAQAATAAAEGSTAAAMEATAAAPSPPAGSPTTGAPSQPPPSPAADLPALLLGQLESYRGTVCTVLSGNDLTAGEAEALMQRDRRWRKRLDRPGAILRVAEADHTFSRPEHWDAAIDWMAKRAAGR
jgi:exosortase A-associated hydrolase 1